MESLTFTRTLAEIQEQGVLMLASSIAIPPRPSILEDVDAELRKEDPDSQRVMNLISQDVSITAAVLKLVNSPFYGLRRKAEHLQDAVSFLGLSNISTLVTSIVLSRVLPTDGPVLARFWDVSAKRSFAMRLLARRIKGMDPNVAHTFGLFCDIGIPLLIKKHPSYIETLKEANGSANQSFTAIEQARHKTDHALVGAVMARSWGITQSTAVAIRLHHDYDAIRHEDVSPESANLIALGLIAERIIQKFEGKNFSLEWGKGGVQVMEHLDLDAETLEEWTDLVHDAFNDESH